MIGHRAKINTTIVLVSFHTFDNGQIDAYDTATLKGPVVRVETNKRMGQPTGTWSVGLKGQVTSGRYAGSYWGNLLEEGDWVTIDALKNGLERNMMIGRIDTIQVSVSAGGTGEANVQITVSGRCVAAPLSDTPIYFNPYDAEHDNASGLDLAAITGVVGLMDAGSLITRTIKGLMGKDGLFGGHVRIPDSLSGGINLYWIDALDPESAVSFTLRGKAVPQMIASEGAPSIWAFMESWRNPVFNEMWIDSPATVSDYRKFYLFVRERPFVNKEEGSWSPWFSLMTRYVDAAFVTQVNITKGANRVNHLMLTAELVYMKDAYGLYKPATYSDSIYKRGLRRIEENTRFFDEFGGDAGGQSEYRKWLDLLVSWNALNHEYWSGQVGIGEMRPDIKIGQKLVVNNGPIGGYGMFPADGGVDANAMSFYIEGVRHIWTEGTRPQASTSLMVSRGFIEGERSSAVSDAYDKFTDKYLDPAASDGDFVYGLDDDRFMNDSEDGGIT